MTSVKVQTTIIIKYFITIVSRDGYIVLFLKFGKKEHLQQLKNGLVHFRPLSTFVEDSSHFRGDCLEGRLLLDLSHPFLINGVDFAPHAKEIIHSYAGFDSVLSFSAAMLNYDNCHAAQDSLFALNADFIEEMLQFGDHVLIFSADEFISELNKKLSSYKCICSYRPIFYCDKTNYAAISDYFKCRRSAGISPDPYDYCFIKDRTPY